MMIHDALGAELGNAADMRAFADFLDKQSDNLASIYASKAGGEVSEWRALMLAETWMFAEEAVEMGLADSIYAAPEKESEETQQDEDAETPEEQQTEEEEGTEEPVEPMMEEDEELNNLMSRRHALMNKGYKYPGRNRAPAPVGFTDNDIDTIVNAWASFGRK
jgi:enoyl-CoA hydratase/carnithine racemase